MDTQNKTAATPAPVNKRKIIVIAAVVCILLLNILWTTLQNKFSFKVDELKGTIAALEERIAAMENRELPDLAEIQKQFQSIQMMAEKYEAQMEQAMKAEEAQLAHLQSQVEAQKARVDSLKSMFGK